MYFSYTAISSFVKAVLERCPDEISIYVGKNKSNANSYDKLNALYQKGPEKTVEAVERFVQKTIDTQKITLPNTIQFSNQNQPFSNLAQYNVRAKKNIFVTLQVVFLFLHLSQTPPLSKGRSAKRGGVCKKTNN